MVQNDNIALSIGDTIIFQTVPMLNVNTITSYADDVIGESDIRYFKRDFQYSLDGGVTWSDWSNLNGTPGNLLQINNLLRTNFHQLVIQFRFERMGTDPTGQLQINSITINGSNVERGSVFQVGSKSLLKDVIFNNINVINLMINLAQKMYEFGIVPAYIERKQSDGFMADEQYVDFWQAITYFYAAIATDSIKFQNIYWRRPLLCEFLQEKNIFLCDCNNMKQMQLIAQNFYAELHARGTEEVFKPQGYEYPVGYRTTYNMPTPYTIQPSTPVLIDGLVYTEVENMPLGWTVNGNVLLSKDKNYHRVRFFDGTDFTIPPTGQSLAFPTNESNILKRYDGEYLRLICYNATCDEFMYNNVPDVYQGWNLGNASPCYRGLRPQRNKSLLKAYEQQASVLDLTKYPLINPGQIYIGIATNPFGVEDTIMYISSDGNPCFPGIPPQLVNISNHLTVNINCRVLNVSGLLKITNLLTNEEFDIPVTLNGVANFSIDTDLQPARYSVELIFQHDGTMVSNVNDGAAVEYDFVDTTGTMDELYNLSNVGSPTIFVNVNFS